MTRRTPRAGALVAALAAAALISACGSSSGGSTGTTSSGSTGSTGSTGSSGALPLPKKDPKVAALVPAAIRSKGTITVASDASYPPMESFAADGKTIVGWDPDMAKGLAAVMGIKANVVNATFDAIIPGLAAKKYDLGMSSFTDTKEREKTVDFVTYFTAGTAFIVKAQGGPKITGLADLCGHKVAVEKGTTQQNDSTAQDKKCRAAGKPGVTVSVFPDQNGANLALSSGRADVVMSDYPVAVYAVDKSNGQFKVVGRQYGTAPFGIALPKGSGLDKPLLAAVKALMADGYYKKSLKKWDISAGAITTPAINGATS